MPSVPLLELYGEHILLCIECGHWPFDECIARHYGLSATLPLGCRDRSHGPSRSKALTGVDINSAHRGSIRTNCLFRFVSPSPRDDMVEILSGEPDCGASIK